MTTSSTSAFGPLVAVYGLVGHDERLLLVRARDSSAFQLPGGLVRPGETVQGALRRTLREQVAVEIVHLDFCTAIELPSRALASGPVVYELALLFDVTIAGRIDEITWCGIHESRWVTNVGLHKVELRPGDVADRLRAGMLSSEAPWWPHV